MPSLKDLHWQIIANHKNWKPDFWQIMVLTLEDKAGLFTLLNPTFHLLNFRTMATTKKLLDFAQHALTPRESNEAKGGKAYVPTNTGSTGYINWDDLVIREGGLSSSPYQKLNLGLLGKHK